MTLAEYRAELSRKMRETQYKINVLRSEGYTQEEMRRAQIERDRVLKDIDAMIHIGQW